MKKEVARPPVVTILGHVDHGKTTLLDYIRKSRLADREHGGITQRIGAYEITTDITGYPVNTITFIDTPGHEAFSKLRARGATIADIALLIIDAKDSVMPQTSESITHIKTAGIPFIVVLNKTDLPEANEEKVKNDLLKEEVAVEGKGGTVPVVSISAKTGKGVADLLEAILLMTTDLKLVYLPENVVEAYVIETKKDKRGIVLSCIIKNGSMKVGQTIYVNGKAVKVRSMFNDLGVMVKEALPSLPFELLGASELSEVGSHITSTPTKIEPKKQETNNKPDKQKLDLEAFLHPSEEEKKLSLVVKADSQNSLEAILDSLAESENIKVMLSGVGGLTKSDVFFAKSTGSIVIGFGTQTPQEIKDLGKQEKVVIKTYNIIYELLGELAEVANLLQEKELQERSLKGEAKILAHFMVEGEKILGIKVLKGKIGLGDEIELYRGENLIGSTKLVSLKIRAKSVSEVKKDQEAGTVFSPPLDFRIGDVVKSIS